MTEYEFYKDHLDELADKVSEIHDMCENCGFDFSKSLEEFMRNPHIGHEDKVKRWNDTTFVVNVALVYNVHDDITDSYRNFDEYKNSIVINAKELMDVAFADVSRNDRPDDYSITNVQLFQFD